MVWSATSLHRFDTELGADAVETCTVAWEPSAGDAQRSLRTLIACATYALNTAGTREGKLWILTIADGNTGDREHGAADQARLASIASVSLPGILDIRWAQPHFEMSSSTKDCASSGPLLFCACSDGAMYAARLKRSTQHDCLRTSARVFNVHIEVSRINCSRAELGKVICGPRLALSLDLSQPCLSCSFSDGAISVLDRGTERLIWDCGDAHQLECWVAAFTHTSVRGGAATGPLCSGGDDGALRIWDTRLPASGASAIASIRQAHETVGVTSICEAHSSSFDAWNLITGGYDDSIRLWDMRMLSDGLEAVTRKTHRSLLSSLNLAGGVWRIKPAQYATLDDVHSARSCPESLWLLCACMYEGVKLVDVSRTQELLSAQAQSREWNANMCELLHYTGHQSNLAYGVAWTSLNAVQSHSSSQARYALSCSFYGHDLHLWHLSQKGEYRAS